MKKILILVGASLLIVCAILLWKSGIILKKHRPNVVLIIIDTLRADKLGCYGFQKKTSPEIDNMAEQGVLFERTISQCSWTRPSIGSMLTSLYPRSIGIYKERWDALHERYLTLAEILNENGYFTIGLTANPFINSVFNFHQGFEDYSDSTVIFPEMKREPGKTKASTNFDNLLRSAKIFNDALEKAKTCSQFPAYIQMVIMEVHSPALVRDEFKGIFEGSGHSDYYDAIRQVSHDIQRFIERTLTVPGWEDTLFILTSDHGEGLDDHPGVFDSTGHGNLLYESQVRVPLIFYHPNCSKNTFRNKRVRRRIRLLDLMPTILDYVHVPIPKDIEGKSLLNLIAGKEEDIGLPSFFVTETNWKGVDKIGVYSDRWKYIENRDNWPGVNPYELQEVGAGENGKVTDKIERDPEIGEELKKYLNLWEALYVKVDSSSYNGKRPSKKELEQLKALGYIK